MNAAFGTSREEWEPLIAQSEAARHGNPLAQASPSPERVLELLGIAKRGIDAWLRYLDASSG